MQLTNIINTRNTCNITNTCNTCNTLSRCYNESHAVTRYTEQHSNTNDRLLEATTMNHLYTMHDIHDGFTLIGVGFRRIVTEYESATDEQLRDIACLPEEDVYEYDGVTITMKLKD